MFGNWSVAAADVADVAKHTSDTRGPWWSRLAWGTATYDLSGPLAVESEARSIGQQ